MKLIKDTISLFYPNLCLFCNKTLLKRELIICTFCSHNLPIINITDFEKNEIATIFYGLIPIKKAVSFLYFKKPSATKELIHQLKYKGKQEIGNLLGNWFGTKLNENNFFTDIDCIIPVPLHPKKEKTRGYNQLTTFGQSLSKIGNVPYLENILLQTSTTNSQTFKKRFERFSDSRTKFLISDTVTLQNKHILLIDDVITTGSTLEACCNELLKTKNITISIATIAFTVQN